MFEVAQMYRDNGKVTCSMDEVQEKKKETYVSKPKYDLYYDYFNTAAEAKYFMNQCKQA